jgi:4-carboxymuconolactone decarboxylase
MHVPQLADRVRALEDYFRFDGVLPAADRELVILVTAREMEARYAWARHEHRAHEEGTSIEAVAAVRANGSLEGLAKRDRLLVEITRALLRTRRLTVTQYAEAVAELGESQLIELVSLAGHYSLIGLTLGAFEVPQLDDLPANYTFQTFGAPCIARAGRRRPSPSRAGDLVRRGQMQLTATAANQCPGSGHQWVSTLAPPLAHPAARLSSLSHPAQALHDLVGIVVAGVRFTRSPRAAIVGGMHPCYG